MTQEQEIQKKYIEYQSVVDHINKLQQQVTLVNQQIVELISISMSLDDVSKAKIKSKTFSQIGSGVFVSSEIKDTKEVLINVGADVAVIKSVDEAKATIEKHISNLKELITNINSDLEKFTIYHQSLQSQIQGMMEKENK